MRNHINMKYLCFADDKRIPPGQCSMPLQDILASGLDAAPVIPPPAHYSTSLWYYMKVEVFIFSVSWNVLLVCLNHVLCFAVMRLLSCMFAVPISGQSFSSGACVPWGSEGLLCCLYCPASVKEGSGLQISLYNGQTD